ncbi:condensation domain-containing protein [Streptomyces sp. NPDC050610]|uniref:condensation domain-containing protein n=1 Tax=Streptomyces sp. NPDC050610 TaxID=3157097 RepID=UPI003443F6A1
MATGTDRERTSATRQEELLRLARSRSRSRGAADHTDPAPEAAAADAGPAPLSYAQRRMWLMDRLGQGGALYSVPFATRVRGPLDVGALGTALSALVARHEALRTRYRQRDGEPWQDVAAPAPVPVPVVDVEDDGRELLLSEARRPFDLAAGPVLRALILRHGQRDHTVMVTLHHIAVDGDSLETIATELAALYAAALDSSAPALAAAPGYTAFARREQSGGDRLAEGLEHWTARLAGARPVPLPRPAAGSAAAGSQPPPSDDRARRERLGRTHVAPLSPSVLEGLREIGQRNRATLFTVALTAAFAVLHRATGENDLVIGCASTHREGSAMRGLVGLCVNTLPIRVDASGDPGFDTLLGRVRDTLLEAQDRRDVPFDLIVERLGAAARGRDGAPLVGVTADVVREATALRLPGTEAEAVEVDPGTAKFDLSFLIEDTDAPKCLLQHGVTALDEESGARLLRSFAQLLEAVAAEPDIALSLLPGEILTSNQPDAPTGERRHPAESCLAGHPDVAEAAVLDLGDQPPLAYAVLRAIGGASPVQLRSYVRSRLDAPSVPAAVMLLDALPRTADGAVDRSRLPGAPAEPPRAVPDAAQGPRARAVLDAFAELLGGRPHEDDDFFVLGGHSLMAVQLAERLRGRLKLPMTGLDVMEQRTPRALAALLDGREAERRAAAPATAPARRGGRAREGTVLVTGGTGGVGAFVLRELAARGRPVRALARPESAHQVTGDGVEVVEGDLSDLDSLRAAAEGVSGVIHAACTFTRPEVDVAAMRTLVDSWRSGTFVFVSSVDAYGQPGAAEVAEGGPSEGPLSAYGQAKLDCERMLLRAAGTEGRGGASAVRSPIVWGAHPRLRDQLRWGATGALYQAALAGEPLVLPDPKQTRKQKPKQPGVPSWYGAPWVHAAALARALAVCVDEPVLGVANAVGGHVGWPELAAELARLLGSGSEIRYASQADKDLDHRWRYRADRLAAPLRGQPGEDWRTVLASMVSPR